MAKEIAEEYTSSLADLTLNSKPLINMLTMLADDNNEHADDIVEAVEKHLEKVRSEYKLPVLYLIDSIVKNVGRTYTTLFTQNIVNTFCSVFEKVDEKVRAQMFKLRQTWNDVFPAKKLYTLDVRVQCIDPAWPITAPAPTPSIHVNPKFFNKPASAAAAAAAATTTKVDSTTLDMQTQLINKQKELLELKQKKLELELLQAKAKLEEQQKQLERQSLIQNKNPQQLLLKPEVAKQLSQSGIKTEESATPVKIASQIVQPQSTGKLTSVATNNGSGGTTRIAPVNSALLASVRPILRDPRLLRQQPTPPTATTTLTGTPTMTNVLVPSSVVTQAQLSTQITSNNFENVNIDDKQNKKSKSHNITIHTDCAANINKTSVNKTGAQSTNNLNRKDPRLLSNKVQGSTANKNKSNNGRPISNDRSPSKTKPSPNQSRKSTKSSQSSSTRSFKSSSSPAHAHKVDVSNSNHADSSNVGTTTSTSSNNSINSNKSVKDSKGSNESVNKLLPAASPIKFKKKSTEHSSPRSSDSNKSVSEQPKRSSKNSSSSSINSKTSRSRDRTSTTTVKYDDDSVRSISSAKSPSPTSAVVAALSSTVHQDQRAFKCVKGSLKNRIYMRRNRTVSISPEPNQDVDLRVGAPPEKQARLQPSTADSTSPSSQQQLEDNAKSTTIDDNSSIKDVDLRTLVVPATISKKRPSTEKLESANVKKSKSQLFDVLFGNEDVDLRQLPPLIPTSAVSVTTQQTSVVTRPPTPPPPIISTLSSERHEVKETESLAKSKETKSNFEAIRAKLANATKISALNKEESRKNTSEDTDMRLKNSVFSSDSAEEVLQKIIISQADEQLIRNGNLSQALVAKVLTLFETQKLQEAQRRESEESTTNLGNITLQPISDDELSVDFSHSDSEDETTKPTKKSDLFGDTDERIPPPAPVISQNLTDSSHLSSVSEKKSEQNLSAHIDPRLSRLAQQNLEHGQLWHAHHARRRPKTHWDSPPPNTAHLGPEPWLRPPPAVLNQSMYGGGGPRRPFPPQFLRQPTDNFAPRMDAPIPAVPPHILESTRTTSPPTIGSQNTKELPLADPLVLEYIEQDTMRTINIDGRPREIRYYEETAIVIMSWDDPREITFQNGTRVVTFDDKESFTLSFNDTYRDVTIGGAQHRIRLGAPTRELYIDGKWYECFFGGPGIGIEIDGKMRVVKMDGPPPHVKIGTSKKNDLVAGKINLIINARQMVPVFLDAKPQKFDIEGKIHTLRFVDALRTVLINEVPFKVEFGGLPKPITVHDKKHFIRFSVLPRGIRPGYVNIANMEGHRFPSPPRNEKENSNEATTTIDNINSVSVTEPALPMVGKKRFRLAERDSSPDSSRNSPTIQQQQLGTLDVLSSIMTSPMANSSNVSGYQVENNQDSQDAFPVTIVPTQPNEIPGLQTTTTTTTDTTAPSSPASVPFLPPNININELFQKLIETGIVTSAKEKTPPPQSVPIQKEENENGIKPVLFTQPETLKIRQPPFVAALYSGMQCSTCGVRFPPEHSKQYSQHLDWHFRQNRRGKNSARKALCRKWYYDVSDWKNFEEIEDIEEREKNWFESQQQQQQSEGVGEDGEEEIEIPSVPADSNSQDTCCEVCHDKFEQFYNEEKEEWHLRMAIRVDDKTYHPVCYEDYKASLENTFEETLQTSALNETNDTSKEESASQDEKPEIEETVKEEEQLPDDKEQDEKMEVTELQSPKAEPKKEEKEDDDVIIEEPHIEQIVIDDTGDLDMDIDKLKSELKTENNSLFGGIVIKQEPIDDDLEICITNIKQEPLDSEIEDHTSTIDRVVSADTTLAEVVSSIDGNVQCSAPQSVVVGGAMPGKIKITITKPIITTKETPAASEQPAEQLIAADSVADNTEPLPPGEEPVQLNLKPALQGQTLTKMPPVSKGTELTGLCSIM